MMPKQNPGRSKQDYGTPRAFLGAVERQFGPIDWDMAASRDNAASAYYYTKADDSLGVDWTMLRGNLWCNPPFARLEPWAKKCAESVGPDRRILLLTPASVGSEWFAQYVHGRSLVLALRPRLAFVGCDAPYPKDLILSVFSTEMADRPGFEPWRWTSSMVPS